ncbi:MAG: aromatic amino acid transport family protein, partial [Shewanella sp.]
PEGFVAVLGFAAVPLVVMIIFLPIAMALRQRQIQPQGYQVVGGTFALGLAGILGAIIIGAQLFVAL